MEENTNVSADTENQMETSRLVPVAESIKYRKRAQQAESQIQQLSQELEAAVENQKLAAKKLSDMELEQTITKKLSAVGAVDLDAAVLIAKTKMEGKKPQEIDSVIENLKAEKQYLFAQGTSAAGGKLSAAKERFSRKHDILEKAASKAARSASRADLQEYLRIRRNLL